MKIEWILIGLCLSTGCASKPSFSEEIGLSAQKRPLDSGEWRLQPGECIGMHVLVGTNETILEAAIDRDGWLNLPQVGKFQLVGMSDSEAGTVLVKACRAKGMVPLGSSPRRTEFYFVTGEVQHPGRQVHLSGLTLRQAIESAGGLTSSAKVSQLRIRRSDGSIEQYDYRRIVNSPAADPEVQPGDVIQVSRKFIW